MLRGKVKVIPKIDRSIEIIYCGEFVESLPIKPEIGRSYLTFRCQIFTAGSASLVAVEAARAEEEQKWKEVITPSEFYFYDIICKQIYRVDVLNEEVYYETNFWRQVLDCSERKLYEIHEDKWLPVCDFADTETINRCTTITDQSEIELELLAEKISIHPLSQISADRCQITGNKIQIKLTNPQPEMLIYSIPQDHTQGFRILVNHLIIPQSKIKLTAQRIDQVWTNIIPSAHFDSNTGIFTCPQTNDYVISITASAVGGAEAAGAEISLKVNSTEILQSSSSIHLVWPLNQGDLVSGTATTAGEESNLILSIYSI